MENKILKKWQHYCSEDLSLIENYEKAILDPDNYVVHHRLGEITPREELKEHELYYNRPAKELIFLTKSEHTSLHGKLNGWHTAQKGVKRSAERNAKMIKTREERKNNVDNWILCITNNTLYFNAAAAARELNIPTTGNIFKCCNGERKTTGGYEFKYYKTGDSYTICFSPSEPLF